MAVQENHLEQTPLIHVDSNGENSSCAEIIPIATKLSVLTDEERDEGARLSKQLEFFFSNPMKKYKIRKQIPYKLILQIIKVFIITFSVVMFANLRMSHVDFLENTLTVMRHTFLKEWSDERDAIIYPPNSGYYSVFSSKEIIDHFAHIVTKYYFLENETFASFSYDTLKNFREIKHTNNDGSRTQLHDFAQIPPMELCIERIANVHIRNKTYKFDMRFLTRCLPLNFTQEELNRIKSNSSEIKNFFANKNITFNSEYALILSKATVRFNLRTIHFSSAMSDQRPECYKISIKVIFDNSQHSGQVFVTVNSLISYVDECNGSLLGDNEYSLSRLFYLMLDILVLSICFASFILCVRALYKAYKLEQKTQAFFSTVLKHEFTSSDKFEFVNLWYVSIVLNDLLLFLGTISKTTIEFHHDFDNYLFTFTGIFLGVGTLLVYIGLFRYLAFLKQYNVLILTVKKCLPDLLKFMLCAFILYCAFVITGWVIIGPYSMKFRTISGTSEALFSLINGDDMFATFYTIDDSNTTIRIFSKIYLYLFVAVFIYLVLSLFIAIIMDAYEAVKSVCDKTKINKSGVKLFMESADVLADSNSNVLP